MIVASAESIVLIGAVDDSSINVIIDASVDSMIEVTYSIVGSGDSFIKVIY